jgi:hypothetical protein
MGNWMKLYYDLFRWRISALPMSSHSDYNGRELVNVRVDLRHMWRALSDNPLLHSCSENWNLQNIDVTIVADHLAVLLTWWIASQTWWNWVRHSKRCDATSHSVAEGSPHRSLKRRPHTSRVMGIIFNRDSRTARETVWCHLYWMKSVA